MQHDQSMSQDEWSESPNDCALLSEAALAVDWLRPEEDEAWRYLGTAATDGPSLPDATP